MPGRKKKKDNMPRPICCLETIGYQNIRSKVLSVLESLNVRGHFSDAIVNKVMDKIHKKTLLLSNNVDDETFFKSSLFDKQAKRNVRNFSKGLLIKEPRHKFVWKKRENKLCLEFEGDLEIESDSSGTCEQLRTATKQYLKEGTNDGDNNNSEIKEQIKNIIEICCEISLSKIVVLSLKDHQGSDEWEESILIITSLLSLLIILLDLLKKKYDDNYIDEYCKYTPALPVNKKKKEKKPEKLYYPASVHRVYPLTPQEMKWALVSKLRTFNDKNYVPLNSSVFQEVFPLTSIRITDKGKLDQRYRITKFTEWIGFSLDGRTTPYTLSKFVPSLTNKIQSVKKEAQDNFFKILQTLEILPANYDVGGKGYLYYKGRPFSFKELCNALDTITKNKLGDRLGRAHENMDRELQEISPLVVELLKIIYSRLMCSATYKDDLMSQYGYIKWQEHVQMIISCIALLIGVLEGTGCTDKKQLRKYLEARISKIWLPKEFSRRRHSMEEFLHGHSFPLAHHRKYKAATEFTRRRLSFPLAHRKCNAATALSNQMEELVDYNHMWDLKEKIESDGFQMKPTPSNGACQFHALAEQVKTIRNEDATHLTVRNDIMELLSDKQWQDRVRCEAEREVTKIPLKLYKYNMRQPDTWGDQTSLKAAACKFNCNIKLISPDHVQELWIKPGETLSTDDTINLGYIKRMHYYSVKPKVRKNTHREYNAEATYSKHMKDLKMKLNWKGFELSTPPTPSNSNCQFYALAEQANTCKSMRCDFKSPLKIREDIVNFLQTNAEEWQINCKDDLDAIGKTLEAYIRHMKEPDTWGDQISLKAAAHVLKCNISLISAHSSVWAWSDQLQLIRGPPDIDDLPTIYLGYIEWTHYTSLEKKASLKMEMQSNTNTRHLFKTFLTIIILFLAIFLIILVVVQTTNK